MAARGELVDSEAEIGDYSLFLLFYSGTLLSPASAGLSSILLNLLYFLFDSCFLLRQFAE